jgi:hypothetical protein
MNKSSPKENYVPIRPGILEHLLRGDISAFEFGVYAIIHLQADYGTGIWRGSAPRILNSAPRGAKLREIQRALEHLTEKGLLKHFHTHGQRGNFPFLINKFTVRSGALKGTRLNADKSESWQAAVYEPCAHDDAHDDAQDAPIQEVRSKSEEGRENHSSVPADSPNEKVPAVQRVWDYYITRFEKNPKLLTFSPIRQQKGLARFAECMQKTGGDLAKAEGLMRVAVDALAASDFHVGRNDRGRRYDSWEKNLFGNREQLERWLVQS